MSSTGREISLSVEFEELLCHRLLRVLYILVYLKILELILECPIHHRLLVFACFQNQAKNTTVFLFSISKTVNKNSNLKKF